MFEPNSIRSLLSKRNSSRAQSATSQQNPTKEQQNSSIDPDYDTIMQVKLMTKQIENKIQNIRQWRQHQKQLMQQKLKSNAQLAQELNEVHMKYMEKQAEREEMELKKILEKLKGEKTQIKIKENQELYDSQRIFNVLNQTDYLREKLRQNNYAKESENIEANYSVLVNEMDKMSHIFSTKEEQVKQSKQVEKVDAKLLQKQMDQIEKELKQIEDLLADDEQDKNKKEKTYNKRK